MSRLSGCPSAYQYRRASFAAVSTASEPPPDAKTSDKTSDKATVVDAKRNSDNLSLTFSFAAVTPAALFRRADTVWLVFDSTMPIDLDPIRSKAGAIIADVGLMKLDKGQAIRIRLNRQKRPIDLAACQLLQIQTFLSQALDNCHCGQRSQRLKSPNPPTIQDLQHLR